LILWGSSPARSATVNLQEPGSVTTGSQQTGDQKTVSPEKSKAVYESSTVLKAVTRLVVVDVIATNHKGEPLTGLTAKDFTLLENGTPQQLRFFSFQSGASMAERTAPSSATQPTNIFTNIPEHTTGSALNVVLLDALNTSLLNQVDVQQQMLKLLAKLPNDRPMAVYVLGDKLRLLQDFTSDPALLQQTIEHWKTQASALLANPSGGPESELYGGRAGHVPKQFILGMISSESDVRAGYTLGALSALAHTLAGYPGRKNLIWVSETFPLYVNSDTTLSAVRPDSTRTYDLEVSKTADALMNAQVAVYPIHTRGMTNIDYFKAGNNGYDAFGTSLINYRFNGLRMQEAGSNLSDNLQSAHVAIDELAERTGGRAFYNTNDFGNAVRLSMDDGSTYYTLGYYPQNKHWDGKFRKVQLKTNHPGAKLRYRFGYFAVDPSSYEKQGPGERARDFGQAMNLDYPVSTALIFKVGVMPPSAKTHNRVAVNYLVDAHAISFERQEDGLQHAILSGAVQVYSEKGEPVKTEATTITAALTPEAFRQVMQNNLPFQMLFDLPPGRYVLRLGVRDDRTGLIGSTNGTVVVN
jgi:VWFA-related protein